MFGTANYRPLDVLLSVASGMNRSQPANAQRGRRDKRARSRLQCTGSRDYPLAGRVSTGFQRRPRWCCEQRSAQVRHDGAETAKDIANRQAIRDRERARFESTRSAHRVGAGEQMRFTADQVRQINRARGNDEHASGPSAAEARGIDPEIRGQRTQRQYVTAASKVSTAGRDLSRPPHWPPSFNRMAQSPW